MKWPIAIRLLVVKGSSGAELDYLYLEVMMVNSLSNIKVSRFSPNFVNLNTNLTLLNMDRME